MIGHGGGIPTTRPVNTGTVRCSSCGTRGATQHEAGGEECQAFWLERQIGHGDA